MADTIQAVEWMLEQECPLRSRAAVTEIIAAASAVRQAHYYSKSVANPDGRFGKFGDVFITSLTGATLPERLEPLKQSMVNRFTGKKKETDSVCSEYPSDGYVISEKFKQVGGPADLMAMCGDCPANASRPIAAGCAGSLRQRPWSGETQEQLVAIVSRLGLSKAISETFITTTPIWFGLWTKSPLSPGAAGVLKTLLSEWMSVDSDPESNVRHGSWREELKSFLKALHIAESGTAKLHVRMFPPGHTDFGWYTIFPHCPLCKAEADVERWKRKYPVEPYTCKVCGTRYSPAAQASSTRDDWEPSPDLRDILGEEPFRAFCKSYLVARGLSETDAAETVELTEARNLQSQRHTAEMVRQRGAIERYTSKSLYAGLPFEIIVDPKNPDEKIGSGFRAEAFEKLIARCQERAIEVTGMSHQSLDEEMGRHHLPLGPSLEKFDPLEMLRKWRAEGCNELFNAYFKIPDALVEAFEKSRIKET